jgi:sulfite exporter TauE/SafE
MVADELRELPGVRGVNVSLKRARAFILSDYRLDIDDIGRAVRRAGYKLGTGERPLISRNPRDWTAALGGIVIAGVLFLGFRQLGIDPSKFLSQSENNVSVVALIMGLTAGFSTCMALIGGLVVGVAARHEKAYPNATRWQNFQPHLAFNLGRIAGFTLFGGLIGLLGSALTFSPVVLGLLTILAGLFMLVIGLQLTGLFPRLTSFSLPPKLAEKLGIDRQKNANYHPLRAALLGGLTFFLPCGFTQAMQLYAVAAGSWQLSALTMGLFALGTTPGLLLVGGLTSLIKGRRGQIALKIVGVLVAAVAFVSINNGFNLTGFRLPNFGAAAVSISTNIPAGNQLAATFLGGSSFDPTEIRVQAGQSYRLNISAEADGVGCMSTVMLPSLSSAGPWLLRAGETVSIEFAASTPGRYQIVCAMGVPFDLAIVVEEA